MAVLACFSGSTGLAVWANSLLFFIFRRVPFAQNQSTLNFQLVPGEWSGYSFLVLAMPPRSSVMAVGYPLLSLPDALRRECTNKPLLLLLLFSHFYFLFLSLTSIFYFLTSLSQFNSPPLLHLI